jgi:hypothetical protein
MNTVASDGQGQLGTATLVLTFDETVDISTYDPSQITLQSTDTYDSASTAAVNLTGFRSNNTVQDGTQISFTLLIVDANEIKTLDALAVSKETSVVTLTEDFVRDMNGNRIAAVLPSNGFTVDAFTADSTPPVLLRFAVDLDAGELALTFDEVVRGLSINPDEITLRGGMNYAGGSNLTLTGGIGATGVSWIKSDTERTFDHPDSEVVTVALTKTDLDELKRLAICTSEDDCWLVHTEFLVYDQRDNNIVRCD